jgi:hypothetical protein
MHSFKNLSSQQMNILLIPFKAKQLINHILSDLMEEQVTMGESLLKEFLFNNIDAKQLTERLDADLDTGGAGWNKQRAASFSKQIKDIMDQAQNIQISQETALPKLVDYLVATFHLTLNIEQTTRLRSFIHQRLDSKINQFELKHKLDAPKILGGVGLHKNTSEKLVREIEMIMLLKYS